MVVMYYVHMTIEYIVIFVAKRLNTSRMFGGVWPQQESVITTNNV